MMQNIDSTVQHSDGTVQKVDSTVKYSDGTVPEFDSTVQHSDGKVQKVDSTVQHSDGTVQKIDSTVKYSDGTVQEIDSTVEYSDGTVQNIDSKVEYSDGTVQKINSTVEYRRDEGIRKKLEKGKDISSHFCRLHRQLSLLTVLKTASALPASSFRPHWTEEYKAPTDCIRSTQCHVKFGYQMSTCCMNETTNAKY
jgi:hypothetical protein